MNWHDFFDIIVEYDSTEPVKPTQTKRSTRANTQECDGSEAKRARLNLSEIKTEVDNELKPSTEEEDEGFGVLTTDNIVQPNGNVVSASPKKQSRQSAASKVGVVT